MAAIATIVINPRIATTMLTCSARLVIKSPQIRIYLPFFAFFLDTGWEAVPRTLLNLWA